MPGLRDILDAATPAGPLRITENICWFWSDQEHRKLPMDAFAAQARLAALAPELAALCLDMGEKLQAIQRWFDSNGHDSGEVAVLLARLERIGDSRYGVVSDDGLDQLGKEQR